MAVSLDLIEDAWLLESPRAIAEVVRSHSADIFYGAAFWLFYCDYSQILTPALGLNSESFVTFHEDEGDRWSDRWVPAEWHWPVLDRACNSMKPAYARISESMEGASRAEWDQLIVAHDQMIARVARSLTAMSEGGTRQFANIPVAKYFVVAAIDDQRDEKEYNKLVRLSVAPDRLQQLEGLIRE
ncbi:MAG: hypothetical protein ACK49R_03225 [Planctomycetota bacterium]|jgi:hypothetical protein